MADFQHQANFARENPTRFESAFARYLFALDRLRTETDDSDEMTGHLTDALVTAENAVMQEPATSLDELRAKADIVFMDANSIAPDRHVWAFFADLIRLTGNTPSRVFDPARWLEWYERLGGGWIVHDGKVRLMWPEDERLDDCLAELKMRGGKGAVMDLIRARPRAKAA